MGDVDKLVITGVKPSADKKSLTVTLNGDISGKWHVKLGLDKKGDTEFSPPASEAIFEWNRPEDWLKHDDRNVTLYSPERGKFIHWKQ